MADDPTELPATPNWGVRALENVVLALRWALHSGGLSADDQQRAREALDRLEA